MRYSDLRIHQLSIKLAGEIKELAKEIPYSWKIREIDQLLRSSDSIHANIVEGFGRRFYRRDFIRFLVYALASSDETQDHHWYCGDRCGCGRRLVVRGLSELTAVCAPPHRTSYRGRQRMETPAVCGPGSVPSLRTLPVPYDPKPHRHSALV